MTKKLINDVVTFDSALKSLSFVKPSNDYRKFVFWNISNHNDFSLGYHCGAEFIDLLRNYPHAIGANLLHKIIRDMGENINGDTARGFFSLFEYTACTQKVTGDSVLKLVQDLEKENSISKSVIKQINQLETAQNKSDITYCRLQVIKALNLTPVGYKNLLEKIGWLKRSNGDATKAALMDGFFVLEVDGDNVRSLLTEKGMKVIKTILGK
ncbi:hypothetical protein [Providencia manganoxydans]|uniref:hypothetical protein n=1 Tax=Providencia manganoxydans TaxID=2923283 RepID=UPI0032DBD661